MIRSVDIEIAALYIEAGSKEPDTKLMSIIEDRKRRAGKYNI